MKRYTAKFDHTLNHIHTPTLGGTYSVGDPYFAPNGTPANYGKNLSLEKKTVIREGVLFLLRFDAFNALNHPNFSTPAANIPTTSTVGVISGSNGNNPARQDADRRQGELPAGRKERGAVQRSGQHRVAAAFHTQTHGSSL